MSENEMISRDENGWHLDKRISIAHILTTIAMAVALAAWVFALQSKVDVNTSGIATHEKVVDVKFAANQLQLEVFRQADREASNERVRQYNDIIRRLERIEDGLRTHQEKTEK